MTDDKRAELTRLAKMAWEGMPDDCVECSPHFVKDGVVVFDSKDNSIAKMSRHPRAAEAMLAALRVLAGEQPAAGLSEREAAKDAEIARLRKGVALIANEGPGLVDAKGMSLLLQKLLTDEALAANGGGE